MSLIDLSHFDTELCYKFLDFLGETHKVSEGP